MWTHLVHSIACFIIRLKKEKKWDVYIIGCDITGRSSISRYESGRVYELTVQENLKNLESHGC